MKNHAEYLRALDAAWSEYIRALSVARAAYALIDESVRAEYLLAKARARVEYERGREVPDSETPVRHTPDVEDKP